MKIAPLTLALSASLLLGACATAPMGPTVQVMPSPTKPFQVFQKDQAECKQYADSQVAGQADAANQKAAGTVAIGAVLGGALGAAVGNHRGAGIIGSEGAIAGTAVAANQTAGAQMSIQDQYNNAYVQCMYARGNQVPGAAAQPTAEMQVAPPPPPPPPAAPQAAGNVPPRFVPMSLAQAQSRLNELGYPVGKPDGMMGRKTHEALRNFQAAHGLPQTGELDSATAAALGN